MDPVIRIVLRYPKVYGLIIYLVSCRHHSSASSDKGLEDTDKYMVANMLEMWPNKYCFRQSSSKTLENILMLKDVHSIQTKIAPTSDAETLFAICICVCTGK